MAQQPDLRIQLGRALQHEPDAAPQLPRVGCDRQQLGPRLAQPGQVPAGLERRADRDVAARREVVERRAGMGRAEPDAVGPGDQQRPAADPPDRRREHLGGLGALLRERDDPLGEQRGHVLEPALDRDVRGARRRCRRPRGCAPDQQRLERGAAFVFQQRRELGLDRARGRSAGDDERGGLAGHSSWNR